MRQGAILIAALVFCVSPQVLAQDGDGPQLPRALITKNSPTNGEENDNIKRFVRHWVDRLAGKGLADPAILLPEDDPAGDGADAGDAGAGADAGEDPALARPGKGDGAAKKADPPAVDDAAAAAARAEERARRREEARKLRIELDRFSADARKQLIEPLLFANASDFFKIVYSRTVSAAIRDANVLKGPRNEGNPRAAARINALIVLSNMQDAMAMQLSQNSIEDRNAACRYWAAKAISEISKDPDKRKVLTKELVKPLVVALRVRLFKEESPMVRVAMTATLVDVNTNESIEGLLQWLNQQVNRIGQGKVTEFDAERAAIVTLKNTIVRQGRNWPMKPDILKQAIRASYRLGEVIATVGVKTNPIGKREQDFLEIVGACDSILRRGELPTRFNPAFNIPAKLILPKRNAQWNQILLGYLNWKGPLKADPKLDFKPADLDVNFAPAN